MLSQLQCRRSLSLPGAWRPAPRYPTLHFAALRSGFRQQLKASVEMIDIASGCAKRTYKSDLWRNRCVNHPYFLLCTQGKSVGLVAIKQEALREISVEITIAAPIEQVWRA